MDCFVARAPRNDEAALSERGYSGQRSARNTLVLHFSLTHSFVPAAKNTAIYPPFILSWLIDVPRCALGPGTAVPFAIGTGRARRWPPRVRGAIASIASLRNLARPGALDERDAACLRGAQAAMLMRYTAAIIGAN